MFHGVSDSGVRDSSTCENLGGLTVWLIRCLVHASSSTPDPRSFQLAYDYPAKRPEEAATQLDGRVGEWAPGAGFANDLLRSRWSDPALGVVPGAGGFADVGREVMT